MTTAPYTPYMTATDKLIRRLLNSQRLRGVGKLIRALLCLRGTDIHPDSLVGTDLRPVHGAPGVVIHRLAKIGSRVTILQGVTVGRGDPWEEAAVDFAGFTIEDDVVLCANATVLNSHGRLTIGEGTVVGANAVLTQSTGEWEIWAGNPARKVGDRPRT